MVVRLLQLEKALSAIDWTLFGIVTFDSFGLFAKAYSPMDVGPLAILTLVRLLQPSKAWAEIVLTFFGIVTLFIPAFEKA